MESIQVKKSPKTPSSQLESQKRYDIKNKIRIREYQKTYQAMRRLDPAYQDRLKGYKKTYRDKMRAERKSANTE